MKTLNLTKKYDQSVVVNDVSFDIKKGKITSFIGPNGAGKSTVMSLISRLIKRDNGTIVFEKIDLNDWKSSELSKHLAILTQQNNVDMKLTVFELVSFGRFPYTHGRLNDIDLDKINHAIEYMGLTNLKDRYVDELSGGQRQRVYIAMVIAQDTEYILLDEPTNNLDIYYASGLMKTVKSLAKDLNKTIIMVLHEINYASFYSDYICALKDGKIFKYGTVDEVINEQTLKELYGVDFKIIKIDGRPLSIYY